MQEHGESTWYQCSKCGCIFELDQDTTGCPLCSRDDISSPVELRLSLAEIWRKSQEGTPVLTKHEGMFFPFRWGGGVIPPQ
mgnify:CR=1 FL=1